MELIKNREKEGKEMFASTYATNYVYNVHWRFGIDFMHMLVAPSSYYDPSFDSIVLRFNHSDVRELYEVFRVAGNKYVE